MVCSEDFMNETLVAKALRIKELDKLIIKAIATWEVSSLAKLVVEFADRKKEILHFLLKNPIVNLASPNDTNNIEAMQILQKISFGQPMPVEMATSGGVISDYLSGELEEGEIDSLGSDLLYSWFSHYEYIEGLYEVGSLILSCGNLPTYLDTFVSEVRNCYVFQQYNAVYVLCRTMLEISVKNVAISKKIIPEDTHKIKQLESRTLDLYTLIDVLCDNFPKYKSLRSNLHEVRKRTNSIVHGSNVVNKQEAKLLLKKTLLVIHELFYLHTA